MLKILQQIIKGSSGIINNFRRMNRVITINFTIMQYAFFSLRLEAGKNIFSEFSCALKIKVDYTSAT